MAPESPKDALDVMDFEPLARKAAATAHWGYMATGVDDDLTLNMNREAFHHYQLRARRHGGCRGALDLKTESRCPWDMPIYISAVGSQRAFHPQAN
jgi:isopentenyl diphosphate isomerase/L-lactate dehydrogenase-like FMN-dependent dehydrogenase